MNVRLAIGSIFALTTLACGGSTLSPATTGGDASTDGGNTTSGNNDASVTTTTGDDGGSTSDAPTTPPLSTVGISGIPLNPGDEKTVCIIVNMKNAEPIMASKLTTTLAPGSHHLIAYRSSATAENLTPTPCPPLGGILGGDIPMMITQLPTDELDFPAGTGLLLGTNQMVKIEAHYINTGSTPITGAGTVNIAGVYAKDAPASTQLVDMMFWGTQKISIPPHASYATPINFQVASADTHGFAVTTHQHRLGTRFRIWNPASATDAAAITDSTPTIADSKAYDAAPLYRLSPNIDFNGTNGLAYKCEWNNVTDATVNFGESALDEMCFLWMYYYPSFGFQVCADGHCYVR
jgi:hypothetical protein